MTEGRSENSCSQKWLHYVVDQTSVGVHMVRKIAIWVTGVFAASSLITFIIALTVLVAIGKTGNVVETAYASGLASICAIYVLYRLAQTELRSFVSWLPISNLIHTGHTDTAHASIQK